jgi:hypothetical protein
LVERRAAEEIDRLQSQAWFGWVRRRMEWDQAQMRRGEAPRGVIGLRDGGEHMMLSL